MAKDWFRAVMGPWHFIVTFPLPLTLLTGSMSTSYHNVIESSTLCRSSGKMETECHQTLVFLWASMRKAIALMPHSGLPGASGWLPWDQNIGSNEPFALLQQDPFDVLFYHNSMLVQNIVTPKQEKRGQMVPWNRSGVLIPILLLIYTSDVKLDRLPL